MTVNIDNDEDLHLTKLKDLLQMLDQNFIKPINVVKQNQQRNRDVRSPFK